jgi:hypothetical protein
MYSLISLVRLRHRELFDNKRRSRLPTSARFVFSILFLIPHLTRTQTLLVEQKVSSEEVVSAQKSFNIDDFIWSHGITLALHHARKRRFRRRANKRRIESVEQEVERLLEQDAMADDVKYGMSICR